MTRYDLITPRAVGLALAALVVVACRSPEAQRQRGDGRGADVGNRNPVVQMHAGSRMYYDTPCLLPGDSCMGPRQASGLPGEFPDPPPADQPRK